MKIKEAILGIIPTLVFNYKAFGIFGTIKRKFPVFVGGGVSIRKISKGSILFETTPKFGMVHIGLGSVPDMPFNHGYLRIDDGANVVFRGTANIGKGCDILIGKGSHVVFGSNFSAGQNLYISSNIGAEFGDDVLLGWNVSVRDSDGHKIVENGSAKSDKKRICVGNHVWIGSDVTILKGVSIESNSVVASHAVVTKPFSESNILLAGFPARKIREDINWEY